MMSSSRDELIAGPAEPAVRIDHLRVIRGKRPALHDFSVQIAKGSITGLLGPSGCGKTTLIRCIVGTQILTKGTVTVLGKTAGSAELRHRVGYLPQDPTIYRDLRVVDNVRYFAALYGFDGQAADAAIDRVGLTDHRTALCANLSGGQRTRVSLACALVCQPDLLVLDEPTVGLDPIARTDVWDYIAGLRAAAPMTVLMTTHYMDEADTYCDRIALMHAGRIRATGSPAELKATLGGDATLDDVFRRYTGGTLADGAEKGGIRDVRRARRTARRLG
jgi:ABC-2 type transport system ATP-binding protein